MEWDDICFMLLDDPMIQSCGCDGLLDAYNTIKGLFGMSEIMGDEITDEFICKAINASIDARNRYCSLNRAEKIPPVKLVGGEFEFEGDDL